MIKTKTERGFSLVKFTDRYGARCAIQKSSLVFEDCIWLGIEDADPKIMASDAIKLGIDNKGESCGWIHFDIPKEVLLNTRMHLTQDMAKELIKELNIFVNTGELS